MKRISVLFDAQGRRRLAELLVWGSPAGRHHYTRTEIEQRILAALTRIADKLEDHAEANMQGTSSRTGLPVVPSEGPREERREESGAECKDQRGHGGGWQVGRSQAKGGSRFDSA